jgi:hypothetical protein
VTTVYSVITILAAPESDVKQTGAVTGTEQFCNMDGKAEGRMLVGEGWMNPSQQEGLRSKPLEK